MHDDVGAVIDRLAEVRRGERVVDDIRHARAFGDLRDRLHVGDDAAGIGDQLGEDRLGLRADRALERGQIVGIGPHNVPAEILERVIELVDRAAIELFRCDEFVARLHQAVKQSKPARRGLRRPQAPRCRPRARRRVPQAPPSSDCRCAYRYCRRFAGRTARPRDRRFQRHRTSSDRSALRARRLSDRAARRHEWRAWKIPECVRS